MDQVLHIAKLFHVQGLKLLQTFRESSGIDPAVNRDQHPGLVLCLQFQEPAPFVLYPDRIDIFQPGTHNHHHLRAVQRGKDIGFIFLSQPALQRHPGKKDLEALFRKPVIQLHGDHGIFCPFFVFVLLLIADEDIKGFFPAGDF